MRFREDSVIRPIYRRRAEEFPDPRPWATPIGRSEYGSFVSSVWLASGVGSTTIAPTVQISHFLKLSGGAVG